MKNALTLHPYESYEHDKNDPDIRIGDKATDDSQIRPYVIFFNEDIEQRLWNVSVKATKNADVFVVMGSTMLVYPAAGLLEKISASCELYIIDPAEVTLPNRHNREYVHIQCEASQGLRQLRELLKS